MMMIDLQDKNNLKAASRNSAFLYFGCGLLMLIILIIDLAIPLGVAGGVPYIAVILLSLWSPQKKITVIVSVICSIGPWPYSPYG